jgi:protein-arginine kinase activator protein McsA
MTYDQYKQETPPDSPWICENCGGEVAEFDVEFIPTETRYVYVTLCPHCAERYYEAQRETADLMRDE